MTVSNYGHQRRICRVLLQTRRAVNEADSLGMHVLLYPFADGVNNRQRFTNSTKIDFNWLVNFYRCGNTWQSRCFVISAVGAIIQWSFRCRFPVAFNVFSRFLLLMSPDCIAICFKGGTDGFPFNHGDGQYVRTDLRRHSFMLLNGSIALEVNYRLVELFARLRRLIMTSDGHTSSAPLTIKVFFAQGICGSCWFKIFFDCTGQGCVSLSV